jgi:hypothetical protein
LNTWHSTCHWGCEQEVADEECSDSEIVSVYAEDKWSEVPLDQYYYSSDSVYSVAEDSYGEGEKSEDNTHGDEYGVVEYVVEGYEDADVKSIGSHELRRDGKLSHTSDDHKEGRVYKDSSRYILGGGWKGSELADSSETYKEGGDVIVSEGSEEEILDIEHGVDDTSDDHKEGRVYKDSSRYILGGGRKGSELADFSETYKEGGDVIDSEGSEDEISDKEHGCDDRKDGIDVEDETVKLCSEDDSMSSDICAGEYLTNDALPMKCPNNGCPFFYLVKKTLRSHRRVCIHNPKHNRKLPRKKSLFVCPRCELEHTNLKNLLEHYYLYHMNPPVFESTY